MKTEQWQAVITATYEQWWAITVATYELIWLLIPFAIALGIARALYRKRKRKP